jgi:hypothetical protein
VSRHLQMLTTDRRRRQMAADCGSFCADGVGAVTVVISQSGSSALTCEFEPGALREPTPGGGEVSADDRLRQLEAEAGGSTIGAPAPGESCISSRGLGRRASEIACTARQ